MERLPELDDALQDASEAIGQRLVIIDETSRVVAYSIHETPIDRVRLSHALAHSDLWTSPATGLRDWDTVELPFLGRTVFHRLLGPDRHIVGHLVVTGSSGGDGQALSSVAERLGLLLADWKRAKDVRQTHAQAMAVALVTGDEQGRREAALQLVRHRYLSASDHYCAVALGMPSAGDDAERENLAATAAQLTARFVHDSSTATVVHGEMDDGLALLVFRARWSLNG